MIPGYNHNIRYKDKVFHVQTEDNGLADPDLVTQVFLGGQIIAIERSSYSEILVDGLDEKERDERIKLRMQDQHKRLLKNLVLGMYDAKLDSYLAPKPKIPENVEVLQPTMPPTPALDRAAHPPPSTTSPDSALPPAAASASPPPQSYKNASPAIDDDIIVIEEIEEPIDIPASTIAATNIPPAARDEPKKDAKRQTGSSRIPPPSATPLPKFTPPPIAPGRTPPPIIKPSNVPAPSRNTPGPTQPPSISASLQAPQIPELPTVPMPSKSDRSFSLTPPPRALKATGLEVSQMFVPPRPSTSDLIAPMPVLEPDQDPPEPQTAREVKSLGEEEWRVGGVEDDDGEMISAESLLTEDAVLELEDVLGSGTIFFPASTRVRDITPKGGSDKPGAPSPSSSSPGSELRTQEDRIYTDDELREAFDKEIDGDVTWSPGAKTSKPRGKSSSPRNKQQEIPPDMRETKLGKKIPGAPSRPDPRWDSRSAAARADKSEPWKTDPRTEWSYEARPDSSEARTEIPHPADRPAPPIAHTRHAPPHTPPHSESNTEPSTRASRHPSDPPAVIDTLIDYGIPASLRKEIDVEIARRRQGSTSSTPPPGADDPRRTMLPPESSRPSDPRVARFRAASSTPSSKTPPPAGAFKRPATTEIDLQLDRAAQRRDADTIQDFDRRALGLEAKTLPEPSPSPIPLGNPAHPPASKSQPPAPASAPFPHMPPPIGSARPGASTSDPNTSGIRPTRVQTGSHTAANPPPTGSQPGTKQDQPPSSILVVERSLDEVILSYLSEDLSGEEP